MAEARSFVEKIQQTDLTGGRESILRKAEFPHFRLSGEESEEGYGHAQLF